MGVLVLAQRPAWPARRDWPSIVVIGTLWFAVYHVALNAAEQRVDARTASMLLQMSPILLSVLAAVFLGEQGFVPLVAESEEVAPAAQQAASRRPSRGS